MVRLLTVFLFALATFGCEPLQTTTANTFSEQESEFHPVEKEDQVFDKKEDQLNLGTVNLETLPLANFIAQLCTFRGMVHRGCLKHVFNDPDAVTTYDSYVKSADQFLKKHRKENP